MPAVRVDLAPLFDALAANNEQAVTHEIAMTLADDIAPSVLAGRLGIPAALGDTTDAALSVLAAAGRLGDWVRVIPPGPEPGADRRQKLSATIPVSSAALFAAQAVGIGLVAKPKFPEPLFPKDITHHDGAWGALRDAVIAGDQTMVGRILMGFYGSGTDYREMEGAIYAALCAKFAGDGVPLLAATGAFTILDYVNWGDRVPVVFAWLLPLLMQGSAEAPGTQAVREFLAQPANNLDFARKRLAMVNFQGAGLELRRALAQGSTAQVVQEVMQALRRNASGAVVASQVAIAAAEYLAAVPLDAAEQITAGAVAVRVANAARIAVTLVQDIRVLPIIFYAANLVNQTITAGGQTRAQPLAGTTSAPLHGGLIEYSVLRNVERQVAARDEVGTRATTRRYAQMMFPGRSLVGTLGAAAAQANIPADHFGRGMLVAQAAGETYLALQPAQQGAEGMALIDAIAHQLMAQPADHALAQRIMQQLGTTTGE